MVTAAEYARIRGVSRNAVSKAIKAGRITFTKAANGRMLLDPNQADRDWAANTDPHRQETGSFKDFAITEQRARDADATPARRKRHGPRAVRSSPDRSLLDAKKRAMQARLALLELDLATMRGELVSRGAMEAVLAPKLIAAAEYMQSIPDRLSAIIAAEPSVEAIRHLLGDEFARVLDMLAVDFQAHTFRRSN